MAKIVHTKVIINAKPSKVWAALTDFGSFSIWNPFIKNIIGPPIGGSRLKVTIAPPNSKPMIFNPQIISLKPNKELIWKGHLFIPKLFDGEHRFLLKEENSCTIFTHEEIFTGILCPFLPSSVYCNTESGFVLMNKALKTLVEDKKTHL